MAPRYTKWTVRGYQRPEHDREGRLVGKDDVVAISEPGGWEWHVVVEGGQVTDVRIVGSRRLPIDTRALSHVPLADLARMATAFHERVLNGFEDGARLEDALEVAEIEPGEVRLNDGSPDIEEFVRAWLAIPGRALDGTPRRDALAEQFGVTVWAVDKWTRNARRRGLLPAATTGRGNRRQNGADGVDHDN